MSLTARRMARTRRQLAETAARLFLERGYDETTVEEIAAEVEVSPRTFFRYFSSKEDVLDEILTTTIASIIASLRDRPMTEPLLASLRAAAATCLGGSAEDPRSFALFGVVHRSPALRARFIARTRDDEGRLAEILATRLGLSTSSPVPLFAAGALIGVVTTIFDFWPTASPDELERLVDLAITALAEGFGLSGAPRDPAALRDAPESEHATLSTLDPPR
jgi:AcrR family transcriptional regulator